MRPHTTGVVDGEAKRVCVCVSVWVGVAMAHLWPEHRVPLIREKPELNHRPVRV